MGFFSSSVAQGYSLFCWVVIKIRGAKRFRVIGHTVKYSGSGRCPGMAGPMRRVQPGWVWSG